MKNVLVLGAAFAFAITSFVIPASAKQKQTRVVDHNKVCTDLNKNLYRTPQDGHVFAIGNCRASRGDISDLR